MRWDVAIAPVSEPVTLSEVKEHLRVTDTQDDTFITNLIIAAREHCEKWLGRKLMQQTISVWLDAWPELYVDLPVGPASTASAVYTYDKDGTQSSHPVSDFYLQPGMYPRFFCNTTAWPRPRRVADGIEIQFNAGFGAASDVPSAIRHGIMVMVAHLYINRGDSPARSAHISGADRLWQPYRSVSL